MFILRSQSRRSGFTLIEMVIAVTILTILAGAAIPLTSTIINSTARRATLSEIEGLASAAREYFEDTGALPPTIGDMLVDPGINGWTGPYLGGVTTDRLTGATSFEVDSWSRPYTVTITGDVWNCRSSGGDATAGTDDDIDINLDVTGVRRQVSLDRLATINVAINRYNADWGSTEPLSSDWNLAFNSLVVRGYLPNSTVYQLDGWGDTFSADPPGALPVVRATSPNL